MPQGGPGAIVVEDTELLKLDVDVGVDAVASPTSPRRAPHPVVYFVSASPVSAFALRCFRYSRRYFWYMKTGWSGMPRSSVPK